MGQVQGVHPFEAAGLGKAPFRVIGVEIRVGPINIGPPGNESGLTVGAPGQPMGCCKFCFTGISECWVIRSADGRVFDVGCDCVRKVGGTRLVKEMAPHLRELRHKAEAKRIAAAQETLKRPEVQHVLNAMPPPERSLSESMLEYIVWMFQFAGNAGKIRVARVIEKTVKELEEKPHG